MVPQVLGSPGKLLLIDSDGCLSLELSHERTGDEFVVSIRDHQYPGVREPRLARFYSVSDRETFVRAICADRMQSLARIAPRRWLYRPRVALA